MQDAQPEDYFRKRAAEESDAAEHAADPRAAASHRELAERYAQKARSRQQPQAEAKSPGTLSSDFKILP